MTIAVGNRSYIGIGEEVTWGTAVAPDVFLLHNSEDLKADDEHLQAGEVFRVGVNADARVQGKVTVAGGFTYNPRYFGKALARLLYHALGTKATARPDITSSATVYRHTLTPADELPTGLTVEVNKHLDAHVFSGCLVQSLRFGFDAQGLMTLAVAMMGKDGTNQDIPTAIANYTEGHVVAIVNASVVLAGTTYKVLGGDLAIENALEPIYIPSARTPQSIVRGAEPRTVTGSFRAYLEDVSLWSRYRNFQRGTLTLTFTGSAIDANYNYDLVFTLPVTLQTSGTPQADSKGPLVVNTAFQCFMDGGNANECSIRVTNTSSTI